MTPPPASGDNGLGFTLLREVKDHLAGWPVKITSTEGTTLQEAESQACQQAEERLAKTRRNP